MKPKRRLVISVIVLFVLICLAKILNPVWLALFSNGSQCCVIHNKGKSDFDKNAQVIIQNPNESKVSPKKEVAEPPLDSLERKMFPDLRNCSSKSLVPKATLNGKFWVLENYIPADASFRCDESITYTTHGEFTYFDSLEPITSRWQGPVSMTVFAPGTDFLITVNLILYFRECSGRNVKKFVTFHILFPVDHFPQLIPKREKLLEEKIDCEKYSDEWRKNVTLYRHRHNLLYPINIARNIAKSNSGTYFSFPLDVEFYPSVNFIPEFFKMLKKPDVSNSKGPRVYVLPVFQVPKEERAPETKSELQILLKKEKAFSFQKIECNECFEVPKQLEWEKAEIKQGLSVFSIGKREGKHFIWEPFYVGTEREPLFDDRFTWEARKDKMIHIYILCLLKYEFHVLDNAFAVHKPGSKIYTLEELHTPITSRREQLIRSRVVNEYNSIFGNNSYCRI